MYLDKKSGKKHSAKKAFETKAQNVKQHSTNNLYTYLDEDNLDEAFEKAIKETKNIRLVNDDTLSCLFDTMSLQTS